MKTWLRIALLVGMILLIIFSLAYWWGTPRVAAIYPSDGAVAVPAGTTLRLSFTRPMKPDSVIERLVIEPVTQGIYTWQGNTLVFTPQGPWPAGEMVRVRLQSGARTDDILALPLSEDASWSFRIGQPRLAFLYPAQGPSSIYVLNPLSGLSERLSGSPGGVLEFDVNASGTTVYYSVSNDLGGSDIYRLPISTYAAFSDQNLGQGGEADTNEPPLPLKIVACGPAMCREPKISPAEDFLAYERTAPTGSAEAGYPQVWLLPVVSLEELEQEFDPSAEVPTELAGDPQHQTLQPFWSPEGLLTFYDTNAAQFVFLEPRSGARSFFPNQTGQPGDWHPNGHDYVAPEIFFVDMPASEGLGDLEPIANSHLLLFNYLDGATQDLTRAEDLEDTAPAFSPGGDYLAFARKYLDAQRWTPGRQLWLMHTGVSQAQPLTDDPYFNHFDFAWSPSGAQIAYVRFNQTELTKPPEIWLIDPFTAQAIELVIGGYAPQWIP